MCMAQICPAAGADLACASPSEGAVTDIQLSLVVSVFTTAAPSLLDDSWYKHHSFIHQGRQLAVGSLPTCLSSYRQRSGLDMAQCSIPLSPWGLYYMFIEPSLAGGFLWQGADTRSSYNTADPYHLLSTPTALTTHQMPPIRV